MIFGIIKQGIKTLYTNKNAYSKIADYCHGCEHLVHSASVRDVTDEYKNQLVCNFGGMKNSVPKKNALKTDCPHVRNLERQALDCRGCMHIEYERELDTWISYCNINSNYKRCKYEK